MDQDQKNGVQGDTPQKIIYQPLDKSTREIRLIQILSDDPNSLVECRLQTHSLDDQPSFVALSYVWGDPQAREDILIDGQLMSITLSLAQALRSARGVFAKLTEGSTILLLWADAICINQQDIAERSWQVQHIMRHVYQDAISVFCWLGSSDDDTVDSLIVVQRIYNAFVLASNDTMAQKWKNLKHRTRLVLSKARMMSYSVPQTEGTLSEHASDLLFQKLGRDLKWMQKHNIFPANIADQKNGFVRRLDHLDSNPYWGRACTYSLDTSGA